MGGWRVKLLNVGHLLSNGIYRALFGIESLFRIRSYDADVLGLISYDLIYIGLLKFERALSVERIGAS